MPDITIHMAARDLETKRKLVKALTDLILEILGLSLQHGNRIVRLPTSTFPVIKRHQESTNRIQL